MSADEFEVIRALFAPLAQDPAARGLADDAAVLSPTARVVTTDAIVEGVHFFADDPIADIAKKALRVNLSDLAGKGAKPVGVLLTLVWSDARPAAQIAHFAEGLAEDLRLFGLGLWGGDTTSTPGPLTVSITAFGEPLGERVPSRADAKAGDDVWVSGTLGDAWLGFLELRGEGSQSSAEERAHVLRRYRVPDPRTDLAGVVARFANASMDLSDGLAGDAAKLAAASRVALHVDVDRVPLSAAGRAWRARAGNFGRLLDWGDDYEILFTAPPSARAAIAGLARDLTRIGEVAVGSGVSFAGAGGTPIAVAGQGHAHRLGR